MRVPIGPDICIHFRMRLQDLCLSCPSLRSWRTFRPLASDVLAAKASAVTIPPATQASLAKGVMTWNFKKWGELPTEYPNRWHSKNSTLILCHKPPDRPESSWWVDPVQGNKCCKLVSRAFFPGFGGGAGQAKLSERLHHHIFLPRTFSLTTVHTTSTRAFDLLTLWAGGDDRLWRAHTSSKSLAPSTPPPPPTPPPKENGTYVTNAKLVYCVTSL